ncbi:MAG TPA: response regulator, partial [Candidatus Acidoferrales bacterium]|nr:response regulator [Candidatus Acidoferrales bacterium]
MNETPIRLGIVDDHPAIAEAVAGAARRATERAMGDGRRPIEVIATARTVAEGLRLFEPGGGVPDVVLCDVQLESGADGLRVLDAAVAAGARVIVLTGFDRAAFARAAFDRGAVGFLSKGADVDEIVEAVRTV